MANKILIIGLDGGTWNIFNPMIESGYMPTLKSLVESGYSGILQSTVPPITATAWSSFQTGLDLGKHGIYDFLKYDPQTGRSALVNSTFIRQRTMWELIAQAGKTVVTINVPLTYPVKRVNNWTVVGGLLAAGIDDNFAYPENIRKELLDCGYRIAMPSVDCRFKMTLDEFIKENIDVEEKRFAFAKEIYLRQKPDMMMVHNQSLDIIQHCFYQYICPDSEFFDKKIFNTIAAFYRKTDEMISDLLQVVEDDTLIFVVSDHGFNVLRKAVLLNNYLRQLGLLKYSRKVIVKDIVNLLKKIDFLNLRKEIFSRIKTPNVLALSSAVTTGFIDLKQSQCYMPNGNLYGNIFFGKVPSESHTDDVIAKLKSLRDDGKEVVKNIWQPKQIYEGASVDKLPDMILEPNPGYAFQTALFRGGSKNIFYPMNYKYDTGGAHDRDGILVIYSSDKKVQKVNGCFHNIVDIAPTILAALSVPIPSITDGKVIEDAFREQLNPTYRKDMQDIGTGDGEGIESQEVIDRLKGLGYI